MKIYNAPDGNEVGACGNMTRCVAWLMMEELDQNKVTIQTIADHLQCTRKKNTDTNNIFDTKIASKLARSYSDNHSLKTLIKEFINIDISKQFQNSDFGGQLNEAQLKYCANDVVYLHKIHEELTKILERENRMELYKQCLKFLKTRVDLDLALFKDDIWSH